MGDVKISTTIDTNIVRAMATVYAEAYKIHYKEDGSVGLAQSYATSATKDFLKLING